MSTLSHLAQHLLQLNPQESTARLAFYHFLKNFLPLEQPFTAEHLRRFYNLALTFEYWQEQRVDLGQRIDRDIKSFFHNLNQFEVSESFQHCNKLQIVKIENVDDALAMVRAHIQKKLGPKFRIQVKGVEDKRVLLLALSQENELLVQTFPMHATIREGLLEPLGPLTKLVYNGRMELLSDRDHVIELGIMQFCRFHRQGDQFFATHIQNHAFQKTQSLEGLLSKNSDLFCSLKRIERHFVNLDTDPYYQELISVIDKSIRTLKSDQPESVSMAHKALDRGQTALHRIFIDDKLLLVLVSNLENRLLERKKRFAEKLLPQVDRCQKVTL